MVNKKEFYVTLAVGLIGGFTIGYSKAREKFLAAMINSMESKNDIVKEENES